MSLEQCNNKKLTYKIQRVRERAAVGILRLGYMLMNEIQQSSNFGACGHDSCLKT